MQLIFLRHGEAVEHGAPGYETADETRPLTPKGIKEMRVVARTLRDLIKPAIIFTSPLVRARQTADIVGAALNVRIVEDTRLDPGFNVGRLAALMREQCAEETPPCLVFVGHEPSFSQTVAALIGPGANLVLKKAGLARVDVAGPDLAGGELRWLLTAGQLTRMAR